MYAKRTVFDLVLPRIMAGEILTKEDLDLLGEGGLCLTVRYVHSRTVDLANAEADNCRTIRINIRNDQRS